MRIPFFKNDELKQKAEDFRNKYWGDAAPVDIEQIIEFNLRVNIVPVPGLYRKCNADALISSDWRTIYVDNDNYSDDRCYNRLRFSLAHEIGHFVLHQDLYASFNIGSVDDFYSVIEKIGREYGIMEGHANRFANFLLVPRDRLATEKEKIERECLARYPEIGKIDSATLNSYVAIPLAKIFNVSQEAMELSLKD